MKKTILLSLFLFCTFITTSCDNELKEHWHKFPETTDTGIGYPAEQSFFQGNWVDIQGNTSVITAITINIVSETVTFTFEISENSRYRYPVNRLGAIYQIKDNDFFVEMEIISSEKIIVRYNEQEVELEKQ